MRTFLPVELVSDPVDDRLVFDSLTLMPLDNDIELERLLVLGGDATGWSDVE
jgi:hypothetical protein